MVWMPGHLRDTYAMTPEDPNENCYVSPEQLCIGLYVFIDLPWFSHSFSFNNFKIRSADQIKGLRELGVKRFRYDPDRSDASAFLASTPPEASPVPAPKPVQAPIEDDPALVAKRERIERLKERREKIGNVEKAFVKAAAIMRNINRSLQSRPKECLEEVGELVDQMARAFLEAPDLTLHVMGEKAGGEEVYYHGLNT